MTSQSVGASAWARFWLAPAPPERLATLRIALGGYAVVYLLARFVHMIRASRGSAHSFEPVGPVTLLAHPLPPLLSDLVLVVTLLCGIAFVVGWRFRVFGPLFAAGLLWALSYRNSWGMIFHTENLVVLHVGILALAPSHAALARDAPPVPAASAARYGWPIRLMAAVTVLTYVIAGTAKLRNSGIEWVTADILRNYVAYDNLRKAELGDLYSPVGALLVRYGWLFPPLAAASLIVELGAPLALVRRRWAAVWAGCAWSFHVGVLAVMAIFFPYQVLGMAYLPFFRVERGAQRLFEWSNAIWPRRQVERGDPPLRAKKA